MANDFIDPDLTLILTDYKPEEAGPLPMPIRYMEVDVELVNGANEAILGRWSTYAFRKLPRQISKKQIKEEQEADLRIADILDKCIERRERLQSLRAPKEKVVNWA